MVDTFYVLAFTREAFLFVLKSKNLPENMESNAETSREYVGCIYIAPLKANFWAYAGNGPV